MQFYQQNIKKSRNDLAQNRYWNVVVLYVEKIKNI